MKRGAPEHFKTIRFATLLGCDRAEALGILEALCNHFAPRSAPQGNVGRCTDEEIAAGCYTTRDAKQVVRALVDAGWLDEDPTYRLLIHDWKEHADEAVRKWLLRNKLRWITPSGLCRVTVRMPSRRHLDGVRPPRAGNGNGIVEMHKAEEPQKRRTGPVPFPDGFRLTDKLREFAEAGHLDAGLEFAHFRDHHVAKGSLFKDWEAAFRTWCRRAVTFPRARG